MTDDPIELAAKHQTYGNRYATGEVSGTNVSVLAHIGDRGPQLYVKTGGPNGEREYEHLDSVEDLDDRFEELVEKHGLEANE